MVKIELFVCDELKFSLILKRKGISLPKISEMSHKSGFVNIIGNPNVGKSTLMNVLVGDKLSVITPKAQTTRHRILGLVNGDDFQIVFSDTPGILNPRYKLQESMMKFVGTALIDADIILFVTDICGKPEIEEKVLAILQKTKIPLLLLLNKTDLAKPEEILAKREDWSALLPSTEIIEISALKKINTEILLNKILTLLPEGEAYYPKDELTDKSERFFVSEIIREKILLNYHQEVPYSVEIVVEEFKEDSKIIRIRANIYVARDSQKGIIIGNKGDAIKRVGIQARKDIETFFGKHVFLDLQVKVSKDWRDSERMLKYFGYNQG